MTRRDNMDTQPMNEAECYYLEDVLQAYRFYAYRSNEAQKDAVLDFMSQLTGRSQDSLLELI